MKMVDRFRVCLWIVALSLPVGAFGQKVCSEALSEAEDRYQSGRLYEVQAVLEECINSGFTREEKIRAYRLLTISHLYLDQYDQANETYLALLRLNPEFQPNPLIDPAELFYLHDQFVTTPKWSLIVGRVGVNFTHLSPYHPYTLDGFNGNTIGEAAEPVEPFPGYTSKKYSFAGGISLGAGAEYNFSDRWSAGTEVLFNVRRYKVEESLLDHAFLTFHEEHYALTAPLYIKYRVSNIRFKPYLFGGISLNFLMRSQARNLRLDRVQNETIIPVTGPSVSLMDNRNPLNYSAVFGGGLRYKIEKNYLALEVRVDMGLNNLVNEENRYSNRQMIYDYMYIDDDMKLSSLLINVSYIRPLYNPRKKK